MKKIGILTFHETRNLGANLQAYALQKKMGDLGADCEIINYQCQAVHERERIPKLSDIRSVKKLIKFFAFFSSNARSKQYFLDFQRNFLKISERVYNPSTISEANAFYDRFLVGSDQIWNLNLSGNDFTYYLDFVTDRKKKQAYACSFGFQEIPARYICQCSQLLREFQSLSVREETGAKIVDGLIHQNVPVVLDPVFLLDKRTWKSFCDVKIKENNYILLYLLNDQKETFRFAEKLARQNRCKIVYVNPFSRPKPFMKNIRALSPEYFLQLIKNAKYVITGSFHGTAFSVYFEKQFFVELNAQQDNLNSRVEDLLNRLNIKNRVLSPQLNPGVIEPIPYVDINQKLEVEREKSIRYLKSLVD